MTPCYLALTRVLAMSLIDDLKKLARTRLRPALKGEAGYKARRYVFKNPKDAVEAAMSFSRRMFRQAKQIGGVTLETAAVRRRETLPPAERAKLAAAAFKRRRSYEKRAQYKGESLKDIHEFEAFKAKRLERHISEFTGEEVGGQHTAEEYAKGKAFAEKHADVEADFLKYVESPTKKGTKKRRLDAKGRNVRDMLHGGRRGNLAPPRRKAA
jgi:hypothetical protein